MKKTKSKAKAAKDRISLNTMLGEIASNYPKAAGILMQHGLHCIGCGVSAFETLEQGAKAHGMDDAEIKKMLKEINSAI